MNHREEHTCLSWHCRIVCYSRNIFVRFGLSIFISKTQLYRSSVPLRHDLDAFKTCTRRNHAGRVSISATKSCYLGNYGRFRDTIVNVLVVVTDIHWWSYDVWNDWRWYYNLQYVVRYSSLFKNRYQWCSSRIFWNINPLWFDDIIVGI